MRNKNRPSLCDWLRTSIVRHFAVGISVVIPVTLSMAVMVTLLVPIMQARAQAVAQLQGQGILTQIEVNREQGREILGITQSVIEKIQSFPQVDYVIPTDTASLSADPDKEPDSSWLADVAVPNPGNLPPDISLQQVQSLSKHEVIAPAKWDGYNFSQWIGRDIPVNFTQKTSENTGKMQTSSLKLVGVYAETWTGAAPGTIYANQELVTEILAAREGMSPLEFIEEIGYYKLIVNVKSTDDVEQTALQLREMGLTPSTALDTMGDLPGLVNILPQLLALAAFLGIILTICFVFSAIKSATIRRTSEFGLLRMRGWSRSRIIALLVIDAGIGAIAGLIAGILIGFLSGQFLTQLLTQTISGTFDAVLVPVIWVALTLLFVCLTTALIAAFRGLRKDPFLAVMVNA